LENDVIGELNTIRDNTIGVKLSESNRNIINNNNFINNDDQAVFNNAFFTTWKRNYWDDRLFFLPKIIRGSFGERSFPWINFDWHPIRKPITV